MSLSPVADAMTAPPPGPAEFAPAQGSAPDVRSAARAAVGVTGNRDVPPLSQARTRPAARRALGLALVNASTTTPLVALALLLPAAAAEKGWSTGILGELIALGLLATALTALPFSDRVPLRRRSRALAILAFNAAVLTLLILLLPPLWAIALLGIVRGVLGGVLASVSRPLAYEAAVPEARARVMARIHAGHALGAALGALFALLAIEGPALGTGQGLVLAGVAGVLLSLGALLVTDTEVGGVEPSRLRRVMGRLDDPLIGLRPRWRDSYSRVSAIPTVRRSLSGYVGVGWGCGLFLIVPILGLGVAREYPARSVPIATVVVGLVSALVLIAVSRGIEKSRRSGAAGTATPATVGLALSGLGLILLAVLPFSVSPQWSLALIGALIAWVSLDLASFSVVQPEDRPALAALTTFSLVSGGLLSLLVVTVLRSLDGDNIPVALVIAALPVLALALGPRRIKASADADLDARLGVDPLGQEFAAEEAGNAAAAAVGAAGIAATGRGLAGADHAPAGPTALAAKNITFSYGSVQVLFDVDLRVGEGEIVALLGPNGVGKTTLLRVPVRAGDPAAGRRPGRRPVDVTSDAPSKRVSMGLSQIVGGNAVFGTMSVAENLQMYGFSMGRRQGVDPGRHRGRVRGFPRLADRRNQLGSTLSGGEQQMLGLSKALISKPQLLIVDEFSLGLAPIIVAELLGDGAGAQRARHGDPARRAVGERRPQPRRPLLLHGEGPRDPRRPLAGPPRPARTRPGAEPGRARLLEGRAHDPSPASTCRSVPRPRCSPASSTACWPSDWCWSTAPAGSSTSRTRHRHLRRLGVRRARRASAACRTGSRSRWR
jgi:ABC-type branched-subunit amino acid transport system ATPase component